jgi:integrase/recombinase XerD
LDEHDALALLDAAAAVGPKVVVLVALLMLEGMKLAEALALDIEQLDGSSWAMRATVTRRGAEQDLALDGRTARAITAYLDGRTTGPLLVGDSPTQDRAARLTRFGADFLLKRAATRAGLEPVSANTLRRTYISLSHRDGAAVEDISRQVGHASARDTRRYIP